MYDDEDEDGDQFIIITEITIIIIPGERKKIKSTLARH